MPFFEAEKRVFEKRFMRLARGVFFILRLDVRLKLSFYSN